MAGVMLPEEREYVRRTIAAAIDYPSLFMGGPSYTALIKAGRIMDGLERAGRLQPSTCAHEEWESYSQHGTHCPTCGMQCHDEARG